MSELLSNVFQARRSDPTQRTQNASLYDQLGGEPAVTRAVTLFCRKVLSDARINYFFFGVDLENQIAKQKSFLTMAFGGPHHYTGRDMRSSHTKLIEMGMNDRHFDIVVEHLKNTLIEQEARDELVAQVVEIVESTRDDVMNRSPRQPPASAPPETKPSEPNEPTARKAATRQVTAPPIPVTPAPSLERVMTRHPVTLSPGDTLEDAARLLGQAGMHAVPVVDAQGRLLGMVTANDLIRQLNHRG